jgi:hypothetical protein
VALFVLVATLAQNATPQPAAALCVMRSIEQLTEEILSLPNESRALLADKLVESLEFDTDSAIQAVWVTEAKRRRDEVRDGSVQPIPGEDALAQVRRLIEP